MLFMITRNLPTANCGGKFAALGLPSRPDHKFCEFSCPGIYKGHCEWASQPCKDLRGVGGGDRRDHVAVAAEVEAGRGLLEVCKQAEACWRYGSRQRLAALQDVWQKAVKGLQEVWSSQRLAGGLEAAKGLQEV
jgi:hypothetical protein